MSAAADRSVKTFCLLFGLLELLGGVVWCIAGAGLYGSPLRLVPREQAPLVGAFLIAGPFSALPAVVTMLWKPRLGAAWLIAGGLGSGILAAVYFSRDRGALLIPLVALPMLAIGVWQMISPVQPLAQGRLDRRRPGRPLRTLLAGVLLFFLGLVAAYALTMVLVASNVTGLRGPPVDINAYANQDLANSVVLWIVAGLIGAATFARKRLCLRGEFVAGMWTAWLLGALVLFAA